MNQISADSGILSRFRTVGGCSKLAGGLADSAKGQTAKKADELKVKFRIGFDSYISQQLIRYSSVKTIISSTRPLKLTDLYVNLQLSTGEKNSKKVRDDDFVQIGGEAKRIIFTATAGAGKSMLMRYLFFLFSSGQSERLPIFIELRDINDHPSITILEFIRDKIQEHLPSFTLEQLKYALKQGMVALFLDGYDEIDHDIRRKRAREINSIAGRYNESIIFISGRPDPSFVSWERFCVYELRAFSERQVRLLIQKIPYEDSIKTRFIQKLDAGLYTSHKEFLVNPLLTLMMLITLEQFAEVPAKIHLFYEYAFEALFARHDATKGGGFQRKRYVSIALDDYRRLFSYFCTISYTRELFAFTESNALDLLSKSVEASQIDVKPKDMLDDLVECTCMFTRDGLEYVFNHRSFQEYFVAYFFARIKVEQFEKVAPKLIVRGPVDNVFFMMSEMNREKFEESWALPQLEKLCMLVENVDPLKDVVAFGKAIFGTDVLLLLFLAHRDGVTVSPRAMLPIGSETISIATNLNQIYGVYERHKRDWSADAPILEKIKKGQLLGSDKRFEAFREQRADRFSTDVRLVESDNEWLREMSIAAWFHEQKKEWNSLREEVSKRVQQRKKGLASILNF